MSTSDGVTKYRKWLSNYVMNKECMASPVITSLLSSNSRADNGTHHTVINM